MRFVIIDTETNGINPKMSRCLSVSWMEVDEHLVIHRKGNEYIFYPYIQIPDEATAVNGLTYEFLEEHGKLQEEVMDTIYPFLQRGNIIAHNASFDQAVLEREMATASYGLRLNNAFCTMRSLTTVCKVPRKNGGYKWPKLIEATQHFGITEAQINKFYSKHFDIPSPPGFHNAAFDVCATYLLLLLGGWKYVRQYYNII